MRSKLTSFFALSLLGLFSINVCQSDEPGLRTINLPGVEAPWLTGSLLSYSGTVTQVGHFDIEPYLYTIVETGQYNNHWQAKKTPNFTIVNTQFLIEVGLTRWMDVELFPGFVYQTTQGKSSLNVDDLPINISFALLSPDNPHKIAIRLVVGETFPLGKYQKLNPKKLATDSTGQGAFTSFCILAIGKLFEFNNDRFMTARVNFGYSESLPVHVKGFNTYGGGYGTRGKVYPGNAFFGILAFEYTLTRNWALALDIYNAYSNKTRFSGKRGVTEAGTPATSTKPSADSFSLAPAIEYNFNKNIGIIAGSWFTVKGRNTERFASAVIAINIYY